MHTALEERDVRTGGAPLFGRQSEAILSGGPLGRIGSLEVRLAADETEVAAAQGVRYRVFYEELGARPEIAHLTDQRDSDRFDALCDHLLVFDKSLPGPANRQIVGTYRLLRQDRARAAGGFYSSDEFELESLAQRHPDLTFLELGRSCVLQPYRTRRVIEVLWQGIWAYVNHYSIGVMTGCASFHGTAPAAHAEALTFLAHHYRASGPWAVRAVPSRYHTMDLMPPDAVSARAATAGMPPLIKGYLRLGAKIGDGCVIDHDFGTVDVFIVLPVSELSARYVNYYGADAQRFAA
ncbi:MAG: GNAT family N-acetyltransferase [Rhizobiaceae bacterium]